MKDMKKAVAAQLEDLSDVILTLTDGDFTNLPLYLVRKTKDLL